MITLSDALPGDAAAIAALCAELDEFYGGLPEGLPAERAAQVRDVLFGDPRRGDDPRSPPRRLRRYPGRNPRCGFRRYRGFCMGR